MKTFRYFNERGHTHRTTSFRELLESRKKISPPVVYARNQAFPYCTFKNQKTHRKFTPDDLPTALIVRFLKKYRIENSGPFLCDFLDRF